MKKRLHIPISRILVTVMILLLSQFVMGQVKDSGMLGKSITISGGTRTIISVLSDIESSLGVKFNYANTLFDDREAVTLSSGTRRVEDVLKEMFGSRQVSWLSERNSIVLRKVGRNSQNMAVANDLTIRGAVYAFQTKEPVVGVTIVIKGTTTGTLTDEKGQFSIAGVTVGSVLQFKSIGFESYEVTVKDVSSVLTVFLNSSVSRLDETVVIGYGASSQRLSTGTITKVKASEIEKQPVTNPLAALAARVPGVTITQTSGLPGTNVAVQIRGRTSITLNNEPLYIIDGVPYSNGTLDQLSLGPISQQSPFASINPLDIESIEVLKDADATAIYGSRASNGVVLITTKKGKAGKVRFSGNVSTGFGKVTRKLDLLNTPEYIQMRREALKNDGLTPGSSGGEDITLWDTTRYFDWQEKLIGGTANLTNAHIGLSGGSAQTQFALSLGFDRQSLVFPGSNDDKRFMAHANITSASANKKLNNVLTVSFTDDDNRLIYADLSESVFLPPNAPKPYDDDGNIVWQENGLNFNNPFSVLRQPYSAKTRTLVGNNVVSFEILKGLKAKANLGYTFTSLDQLLKQPQSALNPLYGQQSSARFGYNNTADWIIEPQLEYNLSNGNHKIELLAGSTFQHSEVSGQFIQATGYSNEALLGSAAAADDLIATTNYSMYRYQAIFGRIKYLFRDTYILSLTGRRDGSSRFGPNKQYANFGSAGFAYLFSNESFVQNHASFLSYGKLRANYGITGNDKIGNYMYLDRWTNTFSPYDGAAGLRPLALFNPDYSWETNKKTEFAIDLGFLNDRIVINAAHYINKSDNQLIRYTLPGQTGGTGITKNLPAIVRNKGWEFVVTTTNLKHADFLWSSSLNFTRQRNILVDYPDIQTSSFATIYEIGQPLNIAKTYHLDGVDPQTGVYKVTDVNKDGAYDQADMKTINNLDPEFFGGLSNTLTYRNLELTFLFQFVKQKGTTIFRNIFEAPGARYNQPVEVLERWQQINDNSAYQKYTVGVDPDAGLAFFLYSQSDAIIKDASYIRLKNVSLSYALPKRWERSLGLSSSTIYLNAQNMLTFTKYLGFDPENMNMSLPPLRMIIAGVKIGL